MIHKYTRSIMKIKLIVYLILAAGFLLFTNLVYINYALHSTPDYQYTGANPHAAADKLVYMSMIQQGREGVLFMKNLHTTEPQKGLLLSPHWYVIGQTANLFNVSNNTSYQLYRVLFIISFLILLYIILGKLFKKSAKFNLAAVFVLFTGGVGWFILLRFPELLSSSKGQLKFLYAPVDLYVTEGNTLLNFTQAPLFSLSQVLILLVFYLFISYRDRRDYKIDILNSFVVAFLILIHPYNAAVIFAVLGSWSIWYLTYKKDWLVIRKLLIVMFGGVVGMAYNIYMLWTEPVIAEWLKQNLVYSPPIKQYILGYGLLFPLWIIGLVAVYRKKRNDPWWMLMLIWSTIVWLLIYLPIDINRRFVNGWHISLAIVAAYGFYFLYQKCLRLWLKIFFSVVTITILVSSIGFFLFISVYFSPATYSYGYYYINTEERSVIEFLRDNTNEPDNILTSDMKTSFTLVSQLNRAVFRGHDHQTPTFMLKQQQMDWFFGTNQGLESLGRKKSFLQDNDIDYVVLNQSRREEMVEWLLEADYLELLFQTENLSVYKVV